MKRWLQLGYQIMGWEQQQPRLRWLLVTQEIGLFALAASRVGAQRSPTLRSFESWFPTFFFCGSVSTELHNDGEHFLWVLRAVSFRLSSAATSLPILQLLGQHLATSEHLRRYGFHPKQLTNSPKIGLLKHLETSRNILKQLGRVGDIKVVLEPVAAIAAAGTGASPATGPWCGRWRWKWMEFLGLDHWIPEKSWENPLKNREVLLFGLEGCRGHEKVEPVLESWLSGLRMVVAGAADAQTEDEILLLPMSCEWRFEPHGNDSRGCNLRLVK